MRLAVVAGGTAVAAVGLMLLQDDSVNVGRSLVSVGVAAAALLALVPEVPAADHMASSP